MSKKTDSTETDDAEANIRNGRQTAAWDACVAALKDLPRENAIRIIASIAIMLDISDDVCRRLRR